MLGYIVSYSSGFLLVFRIKGTLFYQCLFFFVEELRIGFLLHRAPQFFLQVLENDEEYRYYKQQGQCSDKHTTYHTRSQ